MAAKKMTFTIIDPEGMPKKFTKGGKVPTFATWGLVDGRWERFGWSYKGDRLAAEKSARSTIGSLGWQYAVTPVHTQLPEDVFVTAKGILHGPIVQILEAVDQGLARWTEDGDIVLI